MLIGILAVLIGFGVVWLYWQWKLNRLEKKMQKAKRQ